MYQHNHSPWDACILIKSSHPNNEGFGTGFIVGHFEQKSYIVTCAHVIRDVGEDSIEADGKPAKIICLGTDDGLDLAVIKTDELVGKSIIKLAVCGGRDNPFLTAGFHEYGRHFAIEFLEGRIRKQAGLASKINSERINAWKLAIDHSEQLDDGYSGSPVIDRETNFCLGVIIYKTGGGQTGLAISIEELEKLWLEMPIAIKKKSEYQLSYPERLYKQAWDSYMVSKDLGQALDLLNRLKTLDPFYPGANALLRSVQEEMNQPWVIQGRVNGERIVTTVQRGNTSDPPKRKSSSLLAQAVSIYVVIIVVFYTIIALSIAMFYLTGISLISSPFYPLPPDVETLPEPD